MRNYLIVGAGFSGAVLARALAEHGRARVLVIDAREHIGGTCHTARDEATGVMVHQYGPHIFHTNRQDVWDYVNGFGEFRPYINRVKASIDKGIFSLPVNLHTINQFFGKNLSPAGARAFIASLGDSSIGESANFEEQALKLIGRELYDAFFYGYSKKQWGCEPRELPASILKRLPIRFNYNDNYYDSVFQGIPMDGYSAVISRILAHPGIEVKTGLAFDRSMRGEFDHVFYTGAIDAYYGYSLGRLSYRTVFWDRVEGGDDMQGTAVINYPGIDIRHTRVLEHKHFTPWESHDHSVSFIEYSKETEATDVPHYPKRLPDDRLLLNDYAAMAREDHGVSFLGRLATYRYLDMDQVIAEALDFSGRVLVHGAASAGVRFSCDPAETD